jgi:hypothetical protein
MEVRDDSASPSANQEAGVRTSLGDSGSARARKIPTQSPTFYDLLSLLILGSDNERKALLNRGVPLPSSSSSSSSSLGVEISASQHSSPAHLSVACSPSPSEMTGEIGVDKLGSGSGSGSGAY